MSFKEEASSIFEGHKPEGAHIRTYISQIIQDISKVPGFKRLDTWTLGDGMTALFHYKDGNAYEFVIRPAQFSQHKDLWGDRLKKREERTPEEIDELFGIKKKEPEPPKSSYQRLTDMNATIWPVMKKKGFKDKVQYTLKEDIYHEPIIKTKPVRKMPRAFLGKNKVWVQKGPDINWEVWATSDPIDGKIDIGREEEFDTKDQAIARAEQFAIDNNYKYIGEIDGIDEGSGVGEVPPAVASVGNIAYGMTVDEESTEEKVYNASKEKVKQKILNKEPLTNDDKLFVIANFDEFAPLIAKGKGE